MSPNIAKKIVAATLTVRGARVIKHKKTEIKVNIPGRFYKQLFFELKINQPVSPTRVQRVEMMEIDEFCCWRGRECDFCVMDTVS
jgi:hypothetical protein